MVTRVVRWLLVLPALALLTACGDEDGAAPATTTTTAVPDFAGDADSPFCRRSREAATQPVLDPFAPGLDPREVELRFRALAQRFSGFAELAPEPLADDLALLDRRFEELAAILEEAGYDFQELAASGQDLAVFDDSALADVAARLTAYQEQVCTEG
jgi:hypothetical protein